MKAKASKHKAMSYVCQDDGRGEGSRKEGKKEFQACGYIDRRKWELKKGKEKEKIPENPFTHMADLYDKAIADGEREERERVEKERIKDT